jgi:hypothetical protein
VDFLLLISTLIYAEFRFCGADFFVRSVGGNVGAKTATNTTARSHRDDERSGFSKFEPDFARLLVNGVLRRKNSRVALNHSLAVRLADIE